MNKGAFVNKLDFVILGALEVDVDYNVNVVTGSDGILRGAPGGHPDTAAGSKCSIIVVTDYGIAINPRRKDLLEAYKDVKLPFKTIEELRDIAYAIVGKPEEIKFADRVVGIVESRDGTVLDVIRESKPFVFGES